MGPSVAIRLKLMGGGGPILVRGEFLHGTHFPAHYVFGSGKPLGGGAFLKVV